MIAQSIAAFVGCFAALLVLAEVQVSNRILKYLAAFVVGVVVDVVLSGFLSWVVAQFARVHGG